MTFCPSTEEAGDGDEIGFVDPRRSDGQPGVRQRHGRLESSSARPAPAPARAGCGGAGGRGAADAAAVEAAALAALGHDAAAQPWTAEPLFGDGDDGRFYEVAGSVD